MTVDDAYFSTAEGEGIRRRGRRTAAAHGKRRRAGASAHQQLTRDDWIAVARKALIRAGIGAVRIVPLAQSLGVTRGAFYWLFKSRKDLLDALLEDWRRNNTLPFDALLDPARRDGAAEFQKLVDLWIQERDYHPAWDTAIRNWARLSRSVESVVRRVDEHRIALIRQIFVDLGYQDPEALVRARIAYFHQVGYYTLGLTDSAARRLELLPVYVSCLIGNPRR